MAWVCIGAMVYLVMGCATTRQTRLHPGDNPGGALTLAQVMIRHMRDVIIRTELVYQVLRASGIDEAEIRDGSVAVGIVNCCGGPTEELTAIAFFVPESVSALAGDIVEVRLGRAPEKEGDLGEVNRARRVVQKGMKPGDACRWEPPNPRLWGRVLYCDWMPGEGWVQEGPKATIERAWIRRP
jgi:hypothetical protein